MYPTKKIAFQYTNRCPYLCRHCGTNATPVSPEKLDLETTKIYLEQIAANGIKDISFTGGEPLLYKEEIFELVGKCRNLGIESEVVTNGFWAHSTEATAEVMSKLAENNLGVMIISIDKYHLEFVNPDNLHRILVDNQTHQRKIQIVFFILDHTENDPARNLLQQWEEDGLEFAIFSQPIMPVGRAYTNWEQMELKPMDVLNDKSPCHGVFSPFITADNRLYMCCNGFLVGKDSSLCYGVIEDPYKLSEMLNDLFGNCLFHDYLKLMGPVELYDVIPEPVGVDQPYYTSYCHFCINFMKENKEQIDAYMEKEDVKQYIRELAIAVEEEFKKELEDQVGQQGDDSDE